MKKTNSITRKLTASAMAVVMALSVGAIGMTAASAAEVDNGSSISQNIPATVINVKALSTLGIEDSDINFCISTSADKEGKSSIYISVHNEDKGINAEGIFDIPDDSDVTEMNFVISSVNGGQVDGVWQISK